MLVILYRMEHIDELGVALNMDNSYLNQFNSYEFYFVRENSKSISLSRLVSYLNNLNLKLKGITRRMPSFSDYQPNEVSIVRSESLNNQYEVNYMSKWRKVPFKILLTEDSFHMEEIKPPQITQLRLTMQKSSFYNIPMKYVVSCADLKDRTSSNFLKWLIYWLKILILI